MNRYPIEIKRLQIERMVYCRGCSREIQSEEELIRTYSFRATGIYLHFCLDCAKQIGKLAQNNTTPLWYYEEIYEKGL